MDREGPLVTSSDGDDKNSYAASCSEAVVGLMKKQFVRDTEMVLDKGASKEDLWSACSKGEDSP